MKRILSTILILAMMLSVLPVISMAEDATDAPYADSHAAGANAIANPAKAENFNQFNTSAINPVTTTPGVYIWNVKTDIGTNNIFDGKLSGCIFRTTGGDYLDSNFKVAAGEKLILRMPVINSGSTDSVKVNASLINSNNWGKAGYSLEYGEEGVEITDKENWTILEFTFIMPGTTGTEYKPRLVFGFPQGVVAGSGITINLTNADVPQALVGKEIPTAIELTSDAEQPLEIGESIALSAQVLNPFGKVGGLDQEKINWYITNEARTEKIEMTGAFTFAGTNDDMDLTIGEGAAPGNYYAVAESDVDSNVRCGVPFEVLKPKHNDYVASGEETPGTAYDIVLTRTTEDRESYTSLVTLGLNAKLTDKSGQSDGIEQTVSWKILSDNKRDEYEGGINLVSDADNNATVSFDADLPQGTYYIWAYNTNNTKMGKSFEVVIDNSQILGDIINELNGKNDENLKTNLPKYLPYIDAKNTLYEKTDKDALDVVIKAMVEADEKFTAENLADNFELACILALGNVPSEDVVLNGEDGSFVYATKLGLDSVDKDGAVLYKKVYPKEITASGKAKVIAAVCAAKTKADAIAAFAQATLLAAISDTDYLGTNYVTELLTKENLEAAGIEAEGYLDSEAKEKYEEEIAHKTLTKEQLEAILEKEYKKEDEEDDDKKPSKNKGNGGVSVAGPSVSVATPPAEKEEPEAKKDINFADLDETHWAFVNIQFLAKLDVLKGDENGNFNPEKPVTREEFVKILVEAFDLSGATGVTFGDVDNGAWYADYVAIAVANGIINGKADGNFGVGEAVSREDMCVMLARVLGMGQDAEGSLTYADKDEISSYAQNSVGYLSMLSMINGMPDNTFRPKDVCTRSQAARVVADILNYNVMEVNGK